METMVGQPNSRRSHPAGFGGSECRRPYRWIETPVPFICASAAAKLRIRQARSKLDPNYLDISLTPLVAI
jgi:hypothetical protein